MNRREFLKHSMAGAAVLGLQGKSAFGRERIEGVAPGKSRVVVARDTALRDDFRELIPSRVDTLLDRALVAYTGETQLGEAWKHILGKSRRVGIKVNGHGGKRIATHPALVHAIAERLQRAGIRPGNIIIWDSTAADLKACGFTIETDPAAVRYFGSDVAGYEDEQESWGTVQVRLSKILTRECDLVISVPVLNDDRTAGISFAMKNMFGVIDHPEEVETRGCCPAIADLNCIPTIRNKVRFTIGDALSGRYDGRIPFDSGQFWYPNALIVGEDRVAVDEIAWQMVDRRRIQAGLKSLAAAGCSSRYLDAAADATHALGTNDPGKIDLATV